MWYNDKDAFCQFLKFGLVGVSNTLIALVIYYAVLFLYNNYMLANFLSWVISVLNAFYWNNRYVFKNNQDWKKTLAKTYLSYGATLIISMSLLYLQIDCIGISDRIAPLLTLLITVPVNFLLNKLWTFR